MSEYDEFSDYDGEEEEETPPFGRPEKEKTLLMDADRWLKMRVAREETSDLIRMDIINNAQEYIDQLSNLAKDGNIQALKILFDKVYTPEGEMLFEMPRTDVLSIDDLRVIQKEILSLGAKNLIDAKTVKDWVSSTNQMIEAIRAGEFADRLDYLEEKVIEEKGAVSRADLIKANRQ